MKRSKEYLTIDEAIALALLFIESNGAHVFYRKDKGFKVFNAGRITQDETDLLKTQMAPQRERVIGYMANSAVNKNIAYVGMFQTGIRNANGIRVDMSETFDYDEMVSSMVDAVTEVQNGK